jgi:hypothetical protein
MAAFGIQPDYVDYFMGHLLDTYHDIQSVGIEKLNNLLCNIGIDNKTEDQR